MRYVVMECHTSYAVVLAEDGRFLNVANMHYEVGQTVTDVFEMLLPAPASVKRRRRHWIAITVAAAICLITLLVGVLFYLRLPYASVYMSINPTVRIDVKKDNTVIDIKGMNPDGILLIDDYSYENKQLDVVAEELVDLAVEMDYLSNGGEIRLALDAENDKWETYTGNELKHILDEHLDEKLLVTIRLDDDDDDYDDDYDYDD